MEGIGDIGADGPGIGPGFGGPDAGISFGDAPGFGTSAGMGSIGMDGPGLTGSSDAFGGTLGNSMMGDPTGINSFSLADYGLDQGMTSTPGFSFGNANTSAFGTSSFNQSSSLMDTLSKFAKNPVVSFALALASKSNPALAAIGKALGFVNTLTAANQGKGAQAMMGMLGNTAQSFAGIPSVQGVPGLGAAMANSAQGVNSVSQADANTAVNEGNSGSGFDKVLGGLAGLWGYNQANKGLKGQIGTLENMYGPNSPYAQQLRQGLERRDAAAGRRSQYGPREVELQAALAGQYSRNAPTLMQLNQQRTNNRLNALRGAGMLYQQAGGWNGIKGGIQSGIQGLGELFGGGNDGWNSDPFAGV